MIVAAVTTTAAAAAAAADAYDNGCIVTYSSMLVCYKQSRFGRGSDGWLGWQ